jgi:predicted RND superfamily exporter protein
MGESVLTRVRSRLARLRTQRSAALDAGRPHARSLAFGIERIGLVALRHPLLVAAAALALLALAVPGIARLEVDDSIGQLFRAETPAFREYEAASRRFPSSEFDVLVVIEGEALLQRPSVEALRNLATDLQLVEGVRGVISMFSAREPPHGGQLPGPLFPDRLPDGDAWRALIERVQANEIIRDKLLAGNGRLTLMVLALDPEVVASSRLREVVGEVRTTAETDLSGTGLRTQLTGVPVMQLEIRNAIERDRVLYNVAGFAAGCLIAIVFFRRVSFMLVAAAPPLLSIVYALGAFGWLGLRLNIFLNMMTPLIMVISFSDSMQLTFAMRDRLIAGDDKYRALRHAVLVVGPACVLTHATAAISFAALQISESDLIRSFGQAGLVGTALALVAVLTLMPLLGVLTVRREARFAARARRADGGVDLLRRFCASVAARMVRRPALYTLASLLVVAALGAGYAQLEPRFRLADEVPSRGQAVAASDRLDAALTGANPINVMIAFPASASLYAPDTLQTIADVHAILERQPGIGNVWSLETLRRWLAEAGRRDVATLKDYVEVLPDQVVRRFVAAPGDAVMVTGRVRDIDAGRLLPTVQDLDAALDEVRRAHPGYAIVVTSLSAIAARNSAAMINKLSRGITVEAVLIAAFVGLAFRSFTVMLASILPAIFPVAAAGTLLWLAGDGLTFAAVVALTVALGLGLSATIHFLNRMRVEDRPQDAPGVAVERATILMGPPLILTSVVLACGLVVTVLSSLPMLQIFGWLSALAMLLALVADLTILRPTITLLRSVARSRGAARGESGGGGAS